MQEQKSLLEFSTKAEALRAAMAVAEAGGSAYGLSATRKEWEHAEAERKAEGTKKAAMDADALRQRALRQVCVLLACRKSLDSTRSVFSLHDQPVLYE
jgi:hypothetical protein